MRQAARCGRCLRGERAYVQSAALPISSACAPRPQAGPPKAGTIGAPFMATEVIERTQPGAAPEVAPTRLRESWRRAAPVIGAVGLVGTMACGLTIAVDALAEPSFITNGPAGFHVWPAGFLNHLGGHGMLARNFGRLSTAMFVFYVLAVAGAGALRLRLVVASVALLHIAFLLTPILGSKDIYNYLDYARLGVLHGMNPYTHAPNALRSDPLYLLVGWPAWKSPYGPLYTVVS